jgi:glycosyltransferase involved in cell wall biosynthesis
MGSPKSQSQSFCPESCFFCAEGLGLATGSAAISFPYVSCHEWPHHDDSSPSQPLFVPARWLEGKPGQERLFRKLSSASRLIVLLGENRFRAEELLKKQNTHALEIWLIPSRRFDALKALEELPAALHSSLFFYCPLYGAESDLFLRAQELNALFGKIKKKFPDLKITPPPGVDVYNATLDPVDVTTEEKVVFQKHAFTEPEISVVIPAYNNSAYVTKVLRALKDQQPGVEYEVLVVDDGSADQTCERLLELCRADLVPADFTLIHYPRLEGRQMGDFRFRAGAARQRGVRHARGKILAFLDSDILVPPDYIKKLREHHRDFDVVQIQRLYLKEEVSQALSGYEKINEDQDVFHPEGGYWKKFFDDARPWEKIPHFWKYVCTYGLSVNAALYRELGGFRKVFNSYGFEDTDFGYRLARAGARFFKSPVKTYHLWHEPLKSEFSNSALKRHALLSRSANIFYRHHLDSEIFNELKVFLMERRKLKKRWSGK